MKNNFDSSFAKVLRHEGGFVAHPADPGGMTNLGVTKQVWEEWVRRPVTEQVMRNLTPDKVKPLYRRKYWDKVSGDVLPVGVDYCVFDAAVHSGPGRAVKWLQQILGQTQDGVVGPKTLAAANSANSVDLIAKYTATRLTFLQALPTWAVFGRGWNRRIAEVAQAASEMTA